MPSERRPRLRTVPTAPLVVLLLGAQCGSPYLVAPRLSATVRHEIAVPEPVRRLEVSFHDGLLLVEPGVAFGVELAVELLAATEPELLGLAAQVQPETETTDDAMRVRLTPRTAGVMDSTRANWRIAVPRDHHLQVRTRKGSIVARGADCHLEVTGGLGVLDVRMGGGTARLVTTSGSIMLRGEYSYAELASKIGRIDARLPPAPEPPLDVRISGTSSDVYLDFASDHVFDLFHRGGEHTIEVAPELRVDWQVLVELDGAEYLQGRIGPPDRTPTLGRIQLDFPGRLHIRLLPPTGS